MKSRIFIGCSSESLEIAHAIQNNLEYSSETTVWSQGVLKLSQSALESLDNALGRFDFAIFVFAPDDITQMRDKTDRVVRDNVLFEFGLFCGRLGKNRCFIVAPRDPKLHLPSDLIGITQATYDSARSDRIGALGSASSSVRAAVQALGPIQSSKLTGKEAIDDAWQSLIKGAAKSIRIFSGDASWAPRDEELLSFRHSEGIEVKILCEAPRDHLLVKSNVNRLIKASADVKTYSPDLHLRTRGLLVDSERQDASVGLIISKTPKTSTVVQEGKPGVNTLYDYCASWLRGNDGTAELDLMHRLFEAHYALGREALVLARLTLDSPKLVRVLRAVSQYSELEESQVDMRLLDVDQLFSSCTVVKAPKLEVVSNLVTEFENQQVPAFNTVACTSRHYSGVVLPPIVENNGGRYIIIDGIHRLFERMLVKGRHTAQCLVITVDKKLPGDPIRIKDVRIVPEKISRERVFRSYDETAFRRVKDIYRAIERDIAIGVAFSGVDQSISKARRVL